MNGESFNNLPDLIESIKPSILQIKVRDGQGTGFFVRDDGLVLTNKHVVGNETYVKVRTHDGKEYDGQVIKGDESADFAFLFTNAPVSKILQLTDSQAVRLGEGVFSIGHPYGYDFSVSRGIVSSLSRRELKPGLKSVEFIQMDMGINPGNSGGPLMKMTGEVIGMVTMVLMQAHEIAFAVQSKYLIPALEELKPHKKEFLLEKTYCSLCGSLNEKGEKYCVKCGTTVSKPERPAGFNDVLKPAEFSENVKEGDSTVSCPSCGLANSSSENYCSKCGTKLSNQKIAYQTNQVSSNLNCSICGTQNTPGTLYCNKCGTKL